MAHVLVASADAALADALRAGFEGEGHLVSDAPNGMTAYLLALEHAPDLVVLDVVLPLFDGLETCALLRGDPILSPDLPIVLLSNDAIPPRRLESARVTACLPKRIDHAILREWSVRLLGEHAGVR